MKKGIVGVMFYRLGSFSHTPRQGNVTSVLIYLYLQLIGHISNIWYHISCLALDGADIQDRKMQPLCNDSSIPCSNSLLHVTFAISHIILITNSLLHVTFARKAQIIGHTSLYLNRTKGRKEHTSY